MSCFSSIFVSFGWSRIWKGLATLWIAEVDHAPKDLSLLPPPLGKVESRDEEGGVGSGDTILGTKLYSCYIKDAIYSILPIYKTVYIMFQDVLNFIFHFLLKKHRIMLLTLNNI